MSPFEVLTASQAVEALGVRTYRAPSSSPNLVESAEVADELIVAASKLMQADCKALFARSESLRENAAGLRAAVRRISRNLNAPDVCALRHAAKEAR